MSDDAYCLALQQRALQRSDAELFGNRVAYELHARQLAARLIAGSL